MSSLPPASQAGTSSRDWLDEFADERSLPPRGSRAPVPDPLDAFADESPALSAANRGRRPVIASSARSDRVWRAQSVALLATAVLAGAIVPEPPRRPVLPAQPDGRMRVVVAVHDRTANGVEPIVGQGIVSAVPASIPSVRPPIAAARTPRSPAPPVASGDRPMAPPVLPMAPAAAFQPIPLAMDLATVPRLPTPPPTDTLARSLPPPPAVPLPSVPPSAVAAPDVAASAADEADIDAVLARYRRANAALDAHAVAAVWPRVVISALDRAFAQLDSQAFEFHECETAIAGPRARVRCHGEARYVPGIGARRTHVEPRTWTFTLAKRSGGWVIQSVDAR